MPSTQVVSGNQLPHHVISILRDNELLQSDEEVIYFYSSSYSYTNDGNYFTENRVVSYWQEGGGFYTEQASYKEIEDIQTEYSNFFLNDTQVTVYRTDGSEFILLLSPENGIDHQFVDVLNQLWREHCVAHCGACSQRYQAAPPAPRSYLAWVGALNLCRYV